MQTLVTKLNVSIDTSNIPYFNMVELNMVPESDNFLLYSKTNKPITLFTTEGTLTDAEGNTNSEITIHTFYSSKIQISEGVKKVYVKNGLTEIDGFANVILNNGIYLSYVPNATQFRLYSIENASLKDLPRNLKNIICSNGSFSGNINDIKSTALEQFSLFGTNTFSGTLQDLSAKLADQKVISVSFQSNNVSGDISSLFTKISLEKDFTLYMYEAPVSGSVGAMISYLTGKKKSSKVEMLFSKAEVTYQEKKVHKINLNFDSSGVCTVSNLIFS